MISTRMNGKRILSVLLLLLLGSVLATAAAEVSQTRLMSHVRFLSCDALEGRDTAERGDRIAEEYLQAGFSQEGLLVVPGLDGYRQEFTVLKSILDVAGSGLVVERGSKRHRFQVEQEVLYSHKGSTDMTVRAPVVFAGFGITAPEYEYNDYDGIDAEGKIVLVFNHEPGERTTSDRFRGRRPTKYSNPQVKAGIARAQGAVGMIIVSDRANHTEDIDEVIRKRRGGGIKPFLGLQGEETPLPIFYATQPVVDLLLQGSAIDLLEIQQRIDERMQPASSDIPNAVVELSVRLASVEPRTVANIVGLLAGSDPALTDEYIVIGAHHDHVGIADDGGIYHGADDNASGTAGLLEAARILADAELGRSVLFVSFCGEEKGTLGSAYFLDQLPVDNVRCVVNLDMIGRNNMDKDENDNMFIVYTSAQTPALERLVRDEAAAHDFDVRVAPYLRFFGASDHKVFHDGGIPVVFYFTGFHDDYHTVRDTADRIKPEKIGKVVRHLCTLVPLLSNMKGEDLLFDPSITEEPQKDQYERPF